MYSFLKALKQIEEASGYELNEEVINFKVTDKALDIVMYNDKIEVEMTNNEVSVESTSSFKNYGSLLVGILFSGLGIMLLYKLKKEHNIFCK